VGSVATGAPYCRWCEIKVASPCGPGILPGLSPRAQPKPTTHRIRTEPQTVASRLLSVRKPMGSASSMHHGSARANSDEIFRWALCLIRVLNVGQEGSVVRSFADIAVASHAGAQRPLARRNARIWWNISTRGNLGGFPELGQLQFPKATSPRKPLEHRSSSSWRLIGRVRKPMEAPSSISSSVKSELPEKFDQSGRAPLAPNTRTCVDECDGMPHQLGPPPWGQNLTPQVAQA
jgi:hypothetical protein